MDFDVEPIAIIGMSARVPGAVDVEQFWRNLVDGVDCVTVFSREEQLARGVSEEQVADPGFVPNAHVLPEMEGFDAPLFGMTSWEAEFTDPQQRAFLEQAHAALTDAGYDPERFDGEIGVYGGGGPADYLWLNLRTNAQALSAGRLGMAVGNNPEHIATSVSYRLNLRGPSVTVNTACSTSLVAIHLACEALRNEECDMALAGGVCIELPHGQGYIALDGFLSSSGHVRPFDADADGSMAGSGVGVVTLKRLSDATAAGDHIRAVILGNAINNDGANKAGYTAPSVEGQAEVIAQALGMAEVDPRTISYVEAHGTGTSLGDPIEIAAITAVYARHTAETGWCGIGSVKGNLGHLSQAAGVVGLIKTVLAMEHGLIPPSINFDRPNPAIDFAAGPFHVVSTLSKWESTGTPRRAGISSFGIGGTNAHLVIEEAPPRTPTTATATGRPELLQLSAMTPEALEATRSRLVLDGPPLADVAFTLRHGRKAYPHRLAAVAQDATDLSWHVGTATNPKVAFLFSGQGAQYAGMGARLYAAEPAFAAAIDRCGVDLSGDLTKTEFAQPALFALEYALATLWQEWGVRSAAMIGHSIGEYVAATLAGVFSLEDALRLVSARGRLMQSMPAGSMVAVQGDFELTPDVSIAAINGPDTRVVSGPPQAIEEFTASLRTRFTRLRTSHAFHSAMMDPILEEFAALVASVPRSAPRLPFLSNLTGQWITPEQAVDPGYWARHLREPVLFGDCVATLLSEGSWMLLECGPGKQLASLARLQDAQAVASLPGPAVQTDDLSVLYGSAARLWVTGVPVSPGGEGRRVSLPGYPYERKRHWIEPGAAAPLTPAVTARTIDDWFEVPVWHQLPAASDPEQPVERCLFFVAEERGARIAAELRATGTEVVEVRPGEAYEGSFSRVIHAWALAGADLVTAQENGLFSLLRLIQSPAVDGSRIDILTEGTEDVLGGDLTHPEYATVAGITRVAPLEIPGLTVGHLDLGSTTSAAEVIAELRRPAQTIALRNGRRWRRELEPVRVGPPVAIREEGRYLITGGTGGIGLTLAQELGTRFRARLILLSRRGLPDDKRDVIRRIEEAGGRVTVIAADVTDLSRDKVLAVYGGLDGIVHAAGSPGGGMIEVKDVEEARQLLAPKLQGTVALADAFPDVDFLALCSSTVALAGGVGQADYCAANAFLDAFARAAARTRVLSINWGRWLEVGMAAGLGDGTGIRPAEGAEAFLRALTLGPQVVISAVPFAEIAEREAQPVETAVPVRATPYQEPEGELATTLASLWSEVLGVPHVGADDDFFDLGGNSLVAVELLARIRAATGAKVPMRTLFEAPTVKQLAVRIEQLGKAESAIPRLSRR